MSVVQSRMVWVHHESAAIFSEFPLSGLDVGGYLLAEMRTDTNEPALNRFIQDHSEVAFEDLVRANVDLVYSVARRMVAGDTHLAEDVTQTVFADLFRKAPRLPRDLVLGAWLHRRTFYVASSMIRTEQRRRHREQEAIAMNAEQESETIDWASLEPHLDRNLNELSEDDRRAIVLRFFEKLDLRSVGERLGVGEDAARKRVSRALEKLRAKFSKRGLKLSCAGISASLLANAVTTAPAAVAGKTATLVLSGSVAGTGLLVSIQQFLSMNTIKSIAGITIAAGIAVPIVLQQKAIGSLQNENVRLTQESLEIQGLREENDRLSKLAVDFRELEALRQEHLELMRLRGEWTLMNNRIAELETELERQRQLLAAKDEIEEETMSEEERQANRQVLIESRIAELPSASSIWREFGMMPPSNGDSGVAINPLTDSQLERLLERLGETDGVDVLSAPRVLTLNGRQTQIKSVDRKRAITHVSNGVVTTEDLEVGSVIDVLPRFSPDDDKISLNLVVSMNQLVPGDEFGAGLPEQFASLPGIETRQMEVNALVHNGQSFVLSGGYSTYSDGTKGQGEEGEPRSLLVIMTPNEVDAAGNWVKARNEE